jgi:uncharacterized OsmC-like protein
LWHSSIATEGVYEVGNAQAVEEGQPVVNGIQVEDLKALVSTVKQDPRKGLTRWKVTSAWQGRTHIRAEIGPFRLGEKEVERPFVIDIDEPAELGGGNAYPNPQEHLIAALNACMMVGYVALCALQGIALEKLEIQTEGDIDLRGFLGLDDRIPAGYKSLNYTVRIKGDASEEQFAKIHELVMATSPNYYNITRSVGLKPTLVVE